jgi:hypothetical protein
LAPDSLILVLFAMLARLPKRANGAATAAIDPTSTAS